MTGSGSQHLTTPRSSRPCSPRGSVGCLSPSVEILDSGNSNFSESKVLQHNIDHSVQGGDRLGDESDHPTDVMHTLSRELPPLPEGTDLVEEEVPSAAKTFSSKRVTSTIICATFTAGLFHE